MNTPLTQFHKELNLRDLGGYPAKDGRTIKHGLLYRSAALGEATPEELDEIAKLGLKYIVDLRSAEEAAELPEPVIPSANMVRMCGALDADDHEINMSATSMYRILFNPRRVDPDPEDSIISAIAEIYTSIAFNNPAYREMMLQLEAGTVPMLWHCTHGKDRTGIFAMIIMMALGVDQEIILKDFILTNEYLAGKITEKLDNHEWLAKIDAIKFLIQTTEGVDESFGRRVFSEICQEYSSLNEYLLREYGLDEARLAALRNKYLE